MFGTFLTLTSLQIDSMPVTSSTQQSLTTKPVAQQGTASQAQDGVTPMLPAKDKMRVDIEVHVIYNFFV